jgi:WD40 repeat protein
VCGGHARGAGCGDIDGTVRLWDVATHRPTRAPFTVNAGQVYSMALSPDGNTLATGNADDKVRWWNVATRLQIGGPFTDHGGSVGSVAASNPAPQTPADGSLPLLSTAGGADQTRQVLFPSRGTASAVWWTTSALTSRCQSPWRGR